MRRALPLLAILSLLAACGATRRELPMPDGEVFRLNADRWAQNANDYPGATR